MLTPETVPDDEIVATDILALLHIPFGVPSDKAVVAAGHTMGLPVIAEGIELTVNTIVTAHAVAGAGEVGDTVAVGTA